MDIPALKLLGIQKHAINTLPKVTDSNVTVEIYVEKAKKAMSSTNSVIEQVSIYGQQILDELRIIREAVQLGSIKIGEDMKELMKNIYTKDEINHEGFSETSNTGNSYQKQGKKKNQQQSTTVDKKKVDNMLLLQKIAKQQGVLTQLIAKTEELISKIESETNLSSNDLSSINKSLNQWCDTLESTKEKKKRMQKEKELEKQKKREKEKEEQQKRQQEERAKREKEEHEKRQKEKEEREKRDKEEEEKRQKEKEEREKREKEEEERRQKEREKQEKENEEKQRKEHERRRQEEERKRQEEEIRRRDCRNWLPFVYRNSQRNKFKQDICCVILTMPGNINENDVICKGSDTEEDLDKCLESFDEQVLSSMITIIPNKNKKITFELPIRVYVPIVIHDSKLVPTLKFSIKGQKWKQGKPLSELKLPNFENVAFVGVEIPVKELSNIQCVAVASYKKDIYEVNEKGKEFELAEDRNIKVQIPAKAFPGTTSVATRSIPWSQKDIRNAAKQHKELQNIRTVGSFVDISCENVTKEDSEIQMYDFGWLVDETSQKNLSVQQETLYRSSRWLVNNMNPDVNALPLEDVFDSDFLEELETKETTGDKNRFILRSLHQSSDSDFDTFLKKLQSTQAHVASRIKAVHAQVILARKTSEKYSEDDFGNDFDPDFEKKTGSLRVVSKVTGQSWEIVQLKSSNAHPDARFLKLPAGNDKYQVLGLVVPDDMPDENICRAAEILESLQCVTNVSVLCRQKHANPHDIIIDCVLSERVAITMQHLDDIGYKSGPAESSSFGLVDGEEIIIKFEGNLYLERYKNSLLKMKFYKNLPLERHSDHLMVLNRAEQWDSDQYHGHLTFEVTSGRLPVARKGSMVLYVPKPMEEMIGKFAYTLDVPVKAVAKFIAWQLTRENFNSSRWVRLGGYLTIEDNNIYRQIIKHIDTERPKAPQRERCEHFILNWYDHYSHEYPEKIEKIIASHHDAKLETEAQQFIRAYTAGKGIFSNDTIEKIAKGIPENWETFAKKLGCSNDDITRIKSTHVFKVKQALQMLDWWRLTDSAIQKGTDLVKSFHETAKSAQLGARLLTLVSSHL